MSQIGQKIKQVFPDIAILKDQDNYSVFNGRNLPSFVKDYIVKRHIDSDGNVKANAIINFLDKYILIDDNAVKNRLIRSETVNSLCRFVVSTNISTGEIKCAIPDLGIQFRKILIPPYVVKEHIEDLVDGEGVIKLLWIPPAGKEMGYIEMADFKPFRPYKVDLQYFRDCRKQFTKEEWINVSLSAMEYNPEFQRHNTKIGVFYPLADFL